MVLEVQQGPLKISSVAEVMKESKQPAPKSQTSKTEAVAPSEEKEGNLQNVTQREAEVQMFSCTMHPTAGEDRLWEWLQMCML